MVSNAGKETPLTLKKIICWVRSNCQWHRNGPLTLRKRKIFWHDPLLLHVFR